MRESNYYRYFPQVECYGVGRDAKKYDGPYPIIAHPPCGPWGKLKHNCRQEKQCGIVAMNMLQTYGGLVEQPVGSRLFSEHGFDGIELLYYNQGDFGLACKKPTIICVYRKKGQVKWT